MALVYNALGMVTEADKIQGAEVDAYNGRLCKLPSKQWLVY